MCFGPTTVLSEAGHRRETQQCCGMGRVPGSAQRSGVLKALVRGVSQSYHLATHRQNNGITRLENCIQPAPKGLNYLV